MKISIGNFTGFTAEDLKIEGAYPSNARNNLERGLEVRLEALFWRAVADGANAILAKALEGAPIVNTFWYQAGNGTQPTHTARLVCIEEIEK